MASKRKFEKLFEAFRLGQLELKNRIVMPAMATGLTSDEGYVTNQTLDYFEARASGGVGLVIVGYAVVDFPRGLEGPKRLAIDDDKYLPGLASLAEVIKRHGARAAIQLNHAGGFAVSSTTGLQPVAPSSVICRPGGEIPSELSVHEIHNLVLLFARAAERAARAGFEAVQLHAAGTYLINQFLSPSKNKRTDGYGGALKNRARFLLEIIEAVRAEVGPGYPLLAKINGMEYGLPNGIKLDDASELARMLAEAGCCAIAVGYAGSQLPFPRRVEPTGSFLHLAEAVKRVVSVPVIAVGRITPEVGENALAQGKADLVAIARGLLADPELPNKASEGRLEDIRPCITCLTCEILTRAGDGGCTVNPALGKERQFSIRPADEVMEILVIGGGPAGMEAAIMAARRGHRVTLCERGKKLGGQLRLAARMPHRGRIEDLISYLSLQVVKQGVVVQLGKDVTPSVVDSLKPDAIILAAGGKISLTRRIAQTLASILAGGPLNYMEEGGLIVKDIGARRQPFGVHTILLGASIPNQVLLGRLQGRATRIYLVGDCVTPYGMMEAIASGARVGLVV